MNYKDLPCYGCMRCSDCAAEIKASMRKLKLEHGALEHELSCLEEHLEGWDRVDAELAAELDDPYAQRGVSRDDF